MSAHVELKWWIEQAHRRQRWVQTKPSSSVRVIELVELALKLANGPPASLFYRRGSSKCTASIHQNKGFGSYSKCIDKIFAQNNLTIRYSIESAPGRKSDKQ